MPDGATERHPTRSPRAITAVPDQTWSPSMVVLVGNLLGIKDSQIVNHVGAHDRGLRKEEPKYSIGPEAMVSEASQTSEGFHASTTTSKSSMDLRYGQEALAGFGTDHLR